MDVLAAMFHAAKRTGIVANLGAVGLMHRMSIYADNIVVFAKPERAELFAVLGVLDCFGEASELKVSFGKSSVTPIQCPEAAPGIVRDNLPCQVVMRVGLGNVLR
jgi:hypothetical protein